MKKLLFLIGILLFFNQIVLAEGISTKAQALRKMDKSYSQTRHMCLNLADNFNVDPQFKGYLKNQCMLYEVDRQRILPILFPNTTKNGEDYYADYTSQMADYAVKMDENQLKYYKTIITDYCKNNQYKYVRKDPKACERALSLY